MKDIIDYHKHKFAQSKESFDKFFYHYIQLSQAMWPEFRAKVGNYSKN